LRFHESDLTGWLLIGIVLAAYALRLWARTQPSRQRWIPVSSVIIVGVLVGLLILVVVPLIPTDSSVD
jgi:hypothetical protein